MIITTHTDNLIRLYRMNGDNALVQVGQLEATQALDPVVFATMVGDLTVALNWEAPKTSITIKAVTPKPDAAPKATAKKAKPKAKKRISAADASLRRERILHMLQVNGPTTAPEMGAVIFPDPASDRDRLLNESAARAVLDGLVATGNARRLPKPGPGKASPYMWIGG